MGQAAVELIEADASATALLTPFDEQTGFDVAAGLRDLFAVRDAAAGSVAGSAVLGDGALDLHLGPRFRGRGLGGSATAELLERAGDGELTAWSHEDHPAARALAARFGFGATRTLLQLRLDGLQSPDAAASPARAQPARAAGTATIGTFRPGVDEAAWLALNARVFAFHREQGGVTPGDLADRMRAPWFRADDFLVARDGAGRILGYNWVKVPSEGPAGTGEIYVIGVAPEASGQGLGRALMQAGLTRLRERGCDAAELYVEGDNAPAVHLYRRLGFVDAAVHVQYSRLFTSR